MAGDVSDSGSDDAQLISDLRQDGVEVVHLGIFDIEGGLRERRFALPQFEQFLASGPSFVNVIHKWDAADSVTAPGPYLGEPIAIDRASLRRHPFEDKAAILIADYAGASAPLSARNLLGDAVERATQAGLRTKAALEFEFIVLDETAQSLRDKGFADLSLYAPDNRCWSGLSAAVHADFVSALSDVLETGDVSLFGLGMELGPGCFEATLGTKDALAAADDASFFRLFTKAFCRDNDLTASFMALLGAEFPGLSGHVHLSLEDVHSGENLFHDPDGAHGMSQTFQHFVAGITALTCELLPLSAHTVNAYRRTTPGNWAPKTASWAVQNYSAAIRVVPTPQSACRLEYRLSGADTNPHLTLAALISAGLWGIETKAQLPAPIEGGGPDEETAGEPLPHDLYEATERLAASEAARQLFGDVFVDHFVATRRHEELALRKQVSAGERARYLEAP